MYFSAVQLKSALPVIAEVHPFFGFTYLAFKRARIPVGESAKVNFSALINGHLDQYFRPIPSEPRVYSPFSTSNPDERWKSPRYGSTSLQRISADTFGECFLHEKGSSFWGWVPDHVEKLRTHLVGAKIDAVALSVWLFRLVDWGTVPNAVDVADRLRSVFAIPQPDWDSLFIVNSASLDSHEFKSTPIDVADLEALLPPRQKRADVAASRVSRLLIRGLGPSRESIYEPESRVNVITGDNSVGKTFLMDAIWWGATGNWAGSQLLPPVTAAAGSESLMRCLRSFGGRRKESFETRFLWKDRRWTEPTLSKQGLLAIYSRHDGSFLVSDPRSTGLGFMDSSRTVVELSAAEVRRGKVDARTGHSICNGMFRDWVSWQVNPSRYQERWSRFSSALNGLSPPDSLLLAGQPTKLPFDETEIPTLRFGYGEVPLSHVAAGVGRVLALAYVLVWAWSRYQDAGHSGAAAEDVGIVLLVDEIEAHLHPKWQRSVMPSLRGVISELSSFSSTQLHISTHSPLVLASLESFFDESLDGLFSLKLSNGREVELTKEVFVKQGRVDRWLTHPVFGLGMARSIEAEIAITRAKNLIRSESFSPSEASEVNALLGKHLAQDDEFWPGWLHFYELRARVGA